jgi:hypothetical protein
MNEGSVFEHLYQEELYVIPPRTLVLLDKEWPDFSEEEGALLTKILGSVKLSLASVQIIHQSNTSVSDLLSFNPSKIISFGVNVSPIQKQYEYVPLDGVHIIVSDALSRLDDQKKKSLWVALRQMFGV